MVALADFGGLLVLLAITDVDEFERQQVIALIVFVLPRGPARQLGKHQILERLALCLHDAGELRLRTRDKELIGANAQLLQPGFDVAAVDRRELARLADLGFDAFEQEFLEVADLFGRLVFDTDKADGRFWRRQLFDPGA